MRNRFLILFLVLYLLTVNVFAAENVTGEKTFQPVLLNGESVEIGSYLINERNYLKLRDVAALLVGTNSQFNVDWDEATGNVIIETGKPYVKLATDLIPLKDGKVSGVKGNINVLLNGELKQIETTLINENNYLQLRQLGDVVGFGVDWDEKTSAILITTNEAKNVIADEKLKTSNYIELSKSVISDSEKNYNYSNAINVGSILPKFNVEMIDESSKDISVGKLLKDNKVQLINFFKTNCKYCIMEMPDLTKANKRDDLDIILVSIENSNDEIKKLFDENKYELPVFRASDSSTLQTAYNLRVVPTSVFVKDGKVLSVFEGSITEAQLNFIMNELNAGKPFPSNDTISIH